MRVGGVGVGRESGGYLRAVGLLGDDRVGSWGRKGGRWSVLGVFIPSIGDEPCW